MEEYAYLFTLTSLCTIAQVGMVTHFMIKKIKGETLTAIGGYFKDNLKSTISAIIITQITAMAMYFTLATGEPIDLVAFFQVGYLVDNTINKWEKPIG